MLNVIERTSVAVHSPFGRLSFVGQRRHSQALAWVTERRKKKAGKEKGAGAFYFRRPGLMTRYHDSSANWRQFPDLLRSVWRPLLSRFTKPLGFLREDSTFSAKCLRRLLAFGIQQPNCTLRGDAERFLFFRGLTQ